MGWVHGVGLMVWVEFESKVCPIIIVSNSGADNSASRHDSLNLKGSAESGEEND